MADQQHEKSRSRSSNDQKGKNTNRTSSNSSRDDRRRVDRAYFANERRAHFGKAFVKHDAQNSRKMRDEETRRMEEYRRLCKKEGITSKRLEAYDKAKKEQQENIKSKIEEVKDNWRLSKSEEKKRIYAIKRGSEKVKSYLAVADHHKTGLQMKMEKIAAKRQREDDEKQAELDAREKEKSEKIKARKKQTHLMSQRTSTGQPLMSSRITSLLNKIQPKK